MGQALTRIVGFFYTLFLAKNLGVDNFGQLSVALAYFSIISSISDFGFNRFLVREIAKDKLKIYQLFCNIGMFRLTTSAIIFGVFAIFLYFFDSDKSRVSLILLAVLAILPQSIALTLDGIFVALQKLQFSSLGLLISSFANVLIGLYLINQGFGSIGAINAFLLSQLIYGVSLFILLGIEKGFHFCQVELSVIKKAIIGSLPYGLIGMLGLLYFRIDAILLSYLKGNFETGLYGVAYKFLEAIIFVPGAFAAAIFPSLAKLHDKKLAEIKRLYFQSLKLMAILGVLTMIGYIFILPPVIKMYLPSYINAVEAIKILSLSLPFIFMATPGVQVMLSTDKFLKEVIYFSVFTVLFNIVLNLIYIPKFGLWAASWVTVLSDVLSFVVFFIFISRKIFLNGKN